MLASADGGVPHADIAGHRFWAVLLCLFAEDVAFRTLCKVSLGPLETARFKTAILDDYYFELMLDELPIW